MKIQLNYNRYEILSDKDWFPTTVWLDDVDSVEDALSPPSNLRLIVEPTMLKFLLDDGSIVRIVGCRKIAKFIKAHNAIS